MKLLRYGPFGEEKPGLLDAKGGLRDLSGVIPDLAGKTLGSASLAKLKALDPESLPLVQGSPRIGACVGDVHNFIAVGLNFADHAAETGAAIPKEPILFNKAPNCIVGPYDDVMIPKASVKTDWEVELAIVIGDGGSYIDEKDAMAAIAGFCVCNDVSEREFQAERGGQWAKGKGCPTFGPLGPWLVTPDEIADVQNLGMWLEVDGERVQNGSTKTMIFGAAYLVHYISQFMRLDAGDVITTGTPPGVGLGFKPPRFLKGGEVVTLGIEGLGTQKQNFVPYKAA
ncbi:fumarylacetoacetate hydrolase family protein [Bosea psychrotolerans]|uniref:2-keto-4-pentenoate hydratase/2-oxohepta-3-ene-1,7-dioic acid hydratase in catechol pathway n=1 Tax=Bosea psychrotolerans TaxID=1871628 RepID=A0A2S4M919_9HYPH|nr:fumarylacetoacetate hydrolase family protein [Bosea psychrotolerans]POR51238.1 2-keto-4-pentenoate hydratase/2-oxohepta-3-ene-1,7-dioic acid hydratase in catechol pathway [Bosea psychrotolerans]